MEHVVICGAGIIGASIAYHLALRGVRATVVERAEVAGAASGKAAGFLARDWCDGNPMGPLARTSFDLHASLAREFGADRIGYRPVDTLLVAGRDDGAVSGYRRQPAPSWLDGRCAVNSSIGDPANTAQVHPERLTRAFLDAAIERGARLVSATVEGVALGPDRAVRAVLVDGQSIEADAVVVAMGPWSVLAGAWFPMPAIGGLKGYSVVLRPSVPIDPQALFVEFETASGEAYSPEIAARPDGEVYVCGISGDTPLPIDPRAVTVDDGACAELARIAGVLSSSLDGAEVVRRQACYRPICHDAMPLLGPVPETPGAFVATGHNCWGILNAPASGLAMAELIVDGASTSIDLDAFDPARLPALDMRDATA